MKCAWFAVAGLLSLGACSDDDCPDLSVCDITEPSCQRRIAKVVSCMRGGDVALPKVTVLSEDELRERFEDGAEDSDEDEAEYERWSRGLALFDLAPEEYTRSEARDDFVSEIAAVYFFEQKDIVVVDRGEPHDTRSAVQTFAHEMVHALQDAEYDLREYQRDKVTGLDSSLALDALIEGEATLYALLVNLRLRGLSVREVDWRSYFAHWQSDMLETADQHDAPVALASVHFPYAFGGSFVLQHWLAHGSAAVAALFERPPLSTREVLFGASPLALDDEAAALEERAVPVLEGEFEPEAVTALGAWITRVFAGKQGIPVSERLDAAKVLTADVFSVHYDAAEDRVVSAWRVRTAAGGARSWPGLDSSRFQSHLEPDEPEAILLATDGAPPDLESLAWQAQMVSEDEEQASASVLPAWQPPYRRRMAACHLRHQEPWSRDDAQALR